MTAGSHADAARPLLARWVGPALLAGLCIGAAACSDGSTDGLVNLGEAIVDDDDDGWFTNDTNQRVTLRLVAGDFPEEGGYFFVSENARVPLDDNLMGSIFVADSSQTQDLDIVFSRRCIGTWLLDYEEHLLEWTTPIIVRGEHYSESELTWRNRDETVELTVGYAAGDVHLVFETSVVRFPDPDPDDGKADGDQDGIQDREEASLASAGRFVGDPGRRDILLVVGYTHADWKLTGNTRQQLLTRFREKGFNMHIATKPSDPTVWGDAGLMDLGADALEREHVLSLAEVGTMRSIFLDGHTANFAFLSVLADTLSPDAYGWGQNPGRNTAIRSHLPLLGPDIHDYQAKTVMHEIGHNFGLCHPGANSCPTGVLPADEQAGGDTVTGTPADAATPINVVIEALQRPLDYSPTQWSNLDLALGRP